MAQTRGSEWKRHLTVRGTFISFRDLYFVRGEQKLSRHHTWEQIAEPLFHLHDSNSRLWTLKIQIQTIIVVAVGTSPMQAISIAKTQTALCRAKLIMLATDKDTEYTKSGTQIIAV
jgi:hypothetical protein